MESTAHFIELHLVPFLKIIYFKLQSLNFFLYKQCLFEVSME